MSYSIPFPLGGLRGWGLGNQAIILAKAWIAAEVLEKTFVDIPWALNPRGYSKELGGTYLSAAKYIALIKGTTPQRVSAADYIASGEIDYGDFIMQARELWKPSRSMLHVSGMTGGYAGVARARPYLLKRLLFDVDRAVAVASKLDRVKQDAVVLSVHVRAGDFLEVAPKPGEFNRRLPMQWYVGVVEDLLGLTSEPIAIEVVTEPDGVRPAQEAFKRFESVKVSVQVSSRTTTEDLAVLTSGDILITSVSSFSLLGAFLSQKPYIWYRHQTTRVDRGLSIWADEESMHFADLVLVKGQTRGEHGRGYLSPSSQADYKNLGDTLVTALATRQLSNDLLMYGTVEAGR